MREPLCYLPSELRLFYESMRHAGPTCLVILLWVHPVMTLDRLLAAALLTAYMAFANELSCSDNRFAYTYFYMQTTRVCKCPVPKPSTESGCSKRPGRPRKLVVELQDDD
jgi:hypothetical protein